MLRRPPTTLTLTAEDVASYEDRRYQQAQQSQSQPASQQIPQIHFHNHQQNQQDQQQQEPTTAMDLSPSPEHQTYLSTSSNSNPDEPMQDVLSSSDENEAGNLTDPFITAPRQNQTIGRPASPGQARSAYMAQWRARQAQQQQQQQSQQSSSSAAATTTTARGQRTGTPSAEGLGPRAGGGGGGIGTRRTAHSARQNSEPPAAPTRLTRSRDERIGIAPQTGAGTGTGTGTTTRRR
ncbi:hypothetical protein F4778DRAFT_307193 [Xylariomycetidae sp. FL2044]|nr:hypothetical protein F4778DRAFT_307193 [Xylariomycetidae sp. FL2044]